MNKAIIVVIVFVFFSISGRSQSYPFHHYTVDDGLNSNTVYDILQDDKGFIWLATSAGVCRFDGKQFQRFDINQDMADNEVLKIKSDRDKRLWFLHFNGTISILKDDSIATAFDFPVLNKIAPGFFYYSIYADAGGNTWLSTRGDNNCRIKLPGEIKYLPADSTAIFQTKDGYWYYSLNMASNPCNKFTKLRHYPVNAKLISWDYAGDSLIIMLTDSGIVSINSNNELLCYKVNYPVASSTLDVYCDNDLGLWICRAHGGVYYFEKTKEDYKLYDIFLKDEFITSTFRDNEGNVWFSVHGGGVIKMPWNFKTARSFSQKDGLQENEVYSVNVDVKGRVWFGHKFGLIDCLDNGKMHHLRMPQSSDKLGRVIKISQYNNEYVVIAGDDGICFSRISDPDIKLTPVLFSVKSGHPTFFQAVKDFAVDSNGNFYIISHEVIHYLTKKDIETANFRTTPLNLPRKRYYTLGFNNKNEIVYSDFDGLKKLKDSIPISLASLDPLLSKRIVDICELNDNVVLSVLGYGLVIMKDDVVLQHITIKDGLLSNYCSRLFTSGDKIWVCTNNGLSILKKNEKGFVVYDQVTPADGLVSIQVNDVYESGNVIYAATLKGVSEINLNYNERKKIQPLVYFTKITWQGKDISRIVNPSIGYIDKYLRFEYISPFYTYPEGVSYEYCLNNGSWIPTQNTTLEFNSLPPGDYYLQIRARHLVSAWSKAISYPFVIQQPFYKTSWFYFLIFILILMAISIVYILRIRRIKKEQALTLGYELKINSLQTKALQAMVNPHFIFNSLSAIQQQINSGDAAMAGRYLTRFAKLLRKNLETINENYITLEDEIERLNLYLESEKMRLGDKLQYQININKILKPNDILIPSMILQPLIENAIWHGLMPKGSGFVKINIQDISGELSIEIIDNGVGINQSIKNNVGDDNRQHFGLNLTKERLAMLEKKLEKPVTFSITDLSTEGSTGTRIVITLPLIFEN